MLTQQAFNALLKTLEEPPAHVIFVFATTEPHKVLSTILSRCQRFDLRRIPTQIIAKHLSYIAKKEEVTLTQEAAEAIAVAAEGGLRDAESMLDQLVAFCGNAIGESEVLEVFGLTSEHIVANLTRSILNQKSADALSIVHQQAEAGKDLSKLHSDLLGFFRNLLVYKIDPSSLREEIGDQVRGALDELAPAIDAQRLLRLIEKVSEVESTIKWASNKKLHLEIALIRAIQTLSEVDLGAVIDALATLRDGSDQPAETAIASGPSTPSSQDVPKVEGPPGTVIEPSTPAKSALNLSPREPLQQSEPISASEPSVDALWPRLKQLVATRRPLIFSWIERATPTLLGDGIFRLAFPKDQQLAAESLSRPNNRKLLEDILSELLGGSWSLEFETKEEASLAAATEPEDKPTDPLQIFKNDPMIQKALEIFKAEIQSDR